MYLGRFVYNNISGCLQSKKNVRNQLIINKMKSPLTVSDFNKSEVSVAVPFIYICSFVLEELSFSSESPWTKIPFTIADAMIAMRSLGWMLGSNSL